MSSDVIEDADRLYRRIHPVHVKPDGTLSSAAFTDPNMSVDRANLSTPEQTLREYPKFGLAAFTAEFARNLEQEVVSNRLLLNPAHALVNGKKTDRIKRQFAREAEFLKRPTNDG